jgi:hypothetical protein
MLKAIRREHFPEMGSFHLELVAADWIPAIIAFRKKNSQDISYPLLITDFFRYAKDSLAKPMKAPNSHSPYSVIVPIPGRFPGGRGSGSSIVHAGGLWYNRA